MKIILSRNQINILKFSALILSALPLVFTVIDIFDNFNAGSQIGVVGDGFLLVASLYLFGITGSLLYTGNMATGITDFLFYPRRYLKTPPVITTRQKGLISAKQYELAEKELCEMRLEHPESPDVALMLAELHAGIYQAPEVAIADILYYMEHRRWRYHNLNLTLTMRCADFYQQLGRFAKAADLLRRESVRKLVYTERERTVFSARAEAISDSVSE